MFIVTELMKVVSEDQEEVLGSHSEADRIRLLWVFSTFKVGGPQRRMATLTKSLGPGYEHLVFAMDGAFDAESLLSTDVAYRRIEAPVKKGGLISLDNVRQFRRIVAGDAIDLVLTSNWGAIEWLLSNRGRRAVPHVHFEDGFGPDERPDRQNNRRIWMRRLAFGRRKIQFVAPSRVLKDVFSNVWWVGSERVHLIPNGVDLDTFCFVERPSRPVTIGTIAALRREKRIDRLIDCFARSQDQTTRLLIVGDGPEREVLEDKARPLGDRVRFVGEHSDVKPYLSEMDIYAVSSDTEQMPISLVEGMASGLCVAATAVGDIADMVAAENRKFVTSADDEDAFVGSLNDLTADVALRRRLGAVNHRRATERFGLDAMTKSYDSLFKRMILRG